MAGFLAGGGAGDTSDEAVDEMAVLAGGGMAYSLREGAEGSERGGGSGVE